MVSQDTSHPRADTWQHAEEAVTVVVDAAELAVDLRLGFVWFEHHLLVLQVGGAGRLSGRLHWVQQVLLDTGIEELVALGPVLVGLLVLVHS